MTQDRPAAGRGAVGGAVAGPMVVVRFADGRVMKGTTQNFLPNKPSFHLYAADDAHGQAVEVRVEELKAVFFVRSFEGRPELDDLYSFESSRDYGRRCEVEFRDGETIAGYTTGYSAARPGFFLRPAQEGRNNERIFVANASVAEIHWI